MSPDSERFDPRLVLKATPPKVAKSVLHRARLGLNSPDLDDKSVILVSASAGFGKTALLAQWRREAIASGGAVAWLGIDASDDALRFVDGLRLAMMVGTQKVMRDHDFHDVGGYDAPFTRVARWLAQVADFAGEVLLILDDVHGLPESAHDTLAFLLHHLPQNLRVVLASRKPLPFSVAELMAKGQYALVDAEALRLRLPETTTVLQSRFGPRADVDTCARLHDLTDGWPLGVQLIMAGMGPQSDLSETALSLLNHSGQAHRFFIETMLRHMDRRDADFLVALCNVDLLHPDLCRAVTGRADSAEVLHRLCEQTPFLTQAIEGPWYSIHTLGKEFLSERFSALEQDEQRRISAAAAQWLAQHGFHEEAARHALRAGQEEMAFDLAEQSLYETYRTGQLSRVAQWLDRISPSHLERRPRLRIALGWALAKIERNTEAAQVVGPIIDDPAADIADRFESVQIVANAALYADKPDLVQATLAPWRSRFQGFTPTQRLVSSIFDAYLALYQGAPEQARYLLSQPGCQDESAGPYATGVKDWFVAASYLWQGQVVAAERELRRALANVQPVAGRRSPIASMLAATLAMTLWELDAPAEIEGLLADRRDVIDQYAMPDVIALSYVVAARMALQRGAMGVAYELLERLHAIGANHGLARLSVISLAELMRMTALQGRTASCDVIAERLQAVTRAGQARGWGLLQPQVDVQTALAEAYRQIAHQEWGKVAAALAPAKALAESLRRNRDLLQIHLLNALAAQRLGADGETMFREGLFIVDALGLNRILTDTHPALQDWASRLRDETGSLTRPDARSGAAPPGPAEPGGRKEARVAPSVLLTPKERDVLRMLASNLSNKEIASALDLSIQTVKWHLKNLFVKLNAGSRKHLVDRARMLGLLDT
ncbi:LuxR C-terminal-related transcriptional regulator [Ramlibacter sp. 2FC]|uniref:helix-turn-helix transcriptional regulator n=1 Tax=Ramlibacter sp. 2FC TaxID=2502188 RepID=UPI0010F87A77|nr:LuxR C-terminal-related transcriptional regulator [Ramlibacter sp. 2FC]